MPDPRRAGPGDLLNSTATALINERRSDKEPTAGKIFGLCARTGAKTGPAVVADTRGRRISTIAEARNARCAAAPVTEQPPVSLCCGGCGG